MKRIICFSLVFLMIITLASCGIAKDMENLINKLSGNTEENIKKELCGAWGASYTVEGYDHYSVITFYDNDTFDEVLSDGHGYVYGEMPRGGTYTIEKDTIMCSYASGNSREITYTFKDGKLSLVLADKDVENGGNYTKIGNANEFYCSCCEQTKTGSSFTYDSSIVCESCYAGLVSGRIR